MKHKIDGMFNLAKPNLGLANPSQVCLFLTEHTKTEFAKPFFLSVFLNGHLKYSIELESETFILFIESSVVLKVNYLLLI
jgi:hypothetical protein